MKRLSFREFMCYRYKYMQPSNVHDDFDDDNIICQTTFDEIFTLQEEAMIYMILSICF